MPAVQEPQGMWVQSLGKEDPLEEGMATDSSSLAWRIPGTVEPGGIQSIGLQSQTWLTMHVHVIYSIRNIVSSVQFSCSVVSDFLRPHGLQHVRLRCPSPTPGVYSNLCPSSQSCHSTNSSSVIPFSSCLQSFPASGSFPMSQFFPSGSQSTGPSASASVLPINIQDWFPLEWTGWITLQSEGLSIVFSNTTDQKHKFFSAQLLYSPTFISIDDYWKNDVFD